jgi:hypothetical protein
MKKATLAVRMPKAAVGQALLQHGTCNLSTGTLKRPALKAGLIKRG